MLAIVNVAFGGTVLFLAALTAIAATLAAAKAGRPNPLSIGAVWAGVLGLWLALVLFAVRPAALATPPLKLGFFAFPMLFGGAVLVGSLLIATLPALRRAVLYTPLDWPVRLQAARVVGGFFLVWAAFGQAGWTFALVAGIGDLVVGVTAPFAASIVARGGAAGRRAAFWHTMLGLADFASAIATAFLIGGALAWPGPLIPLYLVPLATLIHVWTLIALWRTRG